MPLDETIDNGQAGHVSDHETIAAAINDLGTAANSNVGDFLQPANDLGDVADSATALSNLGAARQQASTNAGAPTNDARLVRFNEAWATRATTPVKSMWLGDSQLASVRAHMNFNVAASDIASAPSSRVYVGDGTAYGTHFPGNATFGVAGSGAVEWTSTTGVDQTNVQLYYGSALMAVRLDNNDDLLATAQFTFNEITFRWLTPLAGAGATLDFYIDGDLVGAGISAAAAGVQTYTGLTDAVHDIKIVSHGETLFDYVKVTRTGCAWQSWTFARSGAKVSDFNHATYAPYLAADIARIDPDLIVIQLATNEPDSATWYTQMNTLIDSIQAASATASIAFIVPPITQGDENLTDWQMRGQWLAFSQNVFLVDISSLFSTDTSHFTIDGVHFSAAGKTLFWSHVYTALFGGSGADRRMVSGFREWWSQGSKWRQDSGVAGTAVAGTWASASSVATVTSVAHGLVSGDPITVTVSSDTGYIPLASYNVTSAVTADTFTIPIANAGTSSGTCTYTPTLFAAARLNTTANAGMTVGLYKDSKANNAYPVVGFVSRPSLGRDGLLMFGDGASLPDMWIQRTGVGHFGVAGTGVITDDGVSSATAPTPVFDGGGITQSYVDVATVAALPANTVSAGGLMTGSSFGSIASSVDSGVTLTNNTGQLILVKDEGANADNNGVYELLVKGSVGAVFTMQRVAYLDAAIDFANTMQLIYVKGGAVHGKQFFTIPIGVYVLGTTAITPEALAYSDAEAASDTAFAASWDGVTTIPPSKNAVYDILTGALTPASVTASGVVKSSGATSGIGYATGAGGTVTQATNKITGVVLNKVSGKITMNNALLGPAATMQFTLSNSVMAAADTIIVNVLGFPGSYQVWADIVAAGGGAYINVKNITAGALSEAVTINFAVIKAVTS